jgi:hypothetical protein
MSCFETTCENRFLSFLILVWCYQQIPLFKLTIKIEISWIYQNVFPVNKAFILASFKKGHRIPPKDLNSPVTKSKDIKVDEIHNKNSK